MPNNKARPLRLAQPLLRFLEEEPLRNRRGRPFKLVGPSYFQFLSAIREIHAKNRKWATDLSITRKLRQRPEYKHYSERQLRRDVGDVISKLVDSKRSRLGPGERGLALIHLPLLRRNCFERRCSSGCCGGTPGIDGQKTRIDGQLAIAIPIT